MAVNLESVLVGGIAGLVSAVITHFATRAKVRLNLAAAYDKKLQESRLAAYMKLWAMLEPLARFGRDEPVTYAVLRELSTKTRTWYFQEGGIYLTEASRGPYFCWKEQMQPLLDNQELARQPAAPMPADRLEAVIAAASTLRTSLSDDIGTKQISWLG